MNEKLQQVGARLVMLRTRLKARTNGDGSARPGYGRNVEDLKAEIEQLEKSTLEIEAMYEQKKWEKLRKST